MSFLMSITMFDTNSRKKLVFQTVTAFQSVKLQTTASINEEEELFKIENEFESA